MPSIYSTGMAKPKTSPTDRLIIKSRWKLVESQGIDGSVNLLMALAVGRSFGTFRLQDTATGATHSLSYTAVSAGVGYSPSRSKVSFSLPVYGVELPKASPGDLFINPMAPGDMSSIQDFVGPISMIGGSAGAGMMTSSATFVTFGTIVKPTLVNRLFSLQEQLGIAWRVCGAISSPSIGSPGASLSLYRGSAYIGKPPSVDGFWGPSVEA